VYNRTGFDRKTPSLASLSYGSIVIRFLLICQVLQPTQGLRAGEGTYEYNEYIVAHFTEEREDESCEVTMWEWTEWRCDPFPGQCTLTLGGWTEEECTPLDEGDPGCGGEGANPLNPATGSVRREIADLSGPGAPKWERYHNSVPRLNIRKQKSSVFGDGGDWRHNWQYDLILGRDIDGNVDMQLVYPSGRKVGLKPYAAGMFVAMAGGPERARLLANGQVDLTAADGSVVHFAPTHTQEWRVWYAPAKLTSSSGRVYQFERAADGRLNRLVDPDGRWLRFVYKDVAKAGDKWLEAATLTTAPAAGQWAEVTLPAGTRLPSSQLGVRVPRGAAVAEIEFYAEGSTQALPGASKEGGLAAFDGNSGTVASDKNLLTAPSGGAVLQPAKVRVLAAPGKEALLVGLTFIVRLIDPPAENQAVIARVETSDGRFVDYDYARNAQAKNEQVVLTTARYGDGTAARYGYSKPADGFGDKALLVTADDPRYVGPAKKIRYDYYQPAVDNQPVGTIKAEINPTTGHAWAKLELDPTKPLKRVVSYSDDRFHVYELTDSQTKTVASRTDSLGRKSSFEHAQVGARPVAIVDYAGRREEAQRDAYGRLLSKRDSKGHTHTHVRDAKGRRIQTTDRHGRVTKIERDSVGQIKRVTKPTGQVHEFTRDSAGRVVAYQGTKGRVTATYDAQGRRISVTDALGNTRTATRDSHGRVIAETDPLGRVTRHEYNERGLATKTTTPDGQSRTFSYDNYGRKVSETDPTGRTATFVYDDLSRMTKQVDFAGRVTTYEFSEFPGGCGSCTLSQQPTRVVGPDGTATTFLYDTEGRVLARTVASGTAAATTTLYEYDLDDNLTSVTDPLGRITRYTYDDEKHRLSATDPLGRVTRWTYDDFGNVATITAPDGGVTRRTYDTAQRLLSETNAAGDTTRFEYDTTGRVLKTINAVGEMTTFAYNSVGQKTAATFADGKRQKWTYDTIGRLTGTVLPDGVTTSTTYDHGNRPQSVTLAIPGQPNQTTTFTYDSLGRRLAATDALGRTMRWTYDARGNVLTVTRPDGQIGTRNTYDAQDNLISTTDAAGGTTAFTYDAARNQTSLTDAKGNTYRFTYDAQRRKTAMIYPDNSQEKWTYDAGGNLLTYTTRAGAIKTIAYNAGNQPVSEIWSAGSGMHDVTYAYDAAGRLRFADNGQAKLAYDYDQLGRLAAEGTDISALVPGMKLETIDYQYDKLGRRSALTYPDNTKVSYEYDARGRLSTIDPQGGGNTPLAKYGYDELGRIEKLTRDNGVVTNYTYDMAGQLTDIAHQQGNTVLAGTHYTLDTLGRRTAQTREDNLTDRYEYDATSQLTKTEVGRVLPNTPTTETFAYDSVGNRTEVGRVVPNAPSSTTKYTTNALNQYTKIDYSLPATGSSLLSYDPNGNLLNDGNQQYTYDAQNRLILVETVGGASRPDAVRAEFFYDPRNRCILRKYYTRGSQSQWVLNTTDSRALTYDSAWNLLTERTLDGKQVGEYIHGQRTDEILRAELVQLPLKPSTSTATVYPLADGLGSTVALTDDKGKVTERYRYTAYGTPNVFTDSYQVSNTPITGYRFLFTGREWLGKINLNDHRNRYYSPSMSSWQSIDPIGFNGGINLYRYAANSPINFVDVDGLAKSWAVGLCTRNLSVASTWPNFTAPDHHNVKVASYAECNCSGAPEFAKVRGFFADDFTEAIVAYLNPYSSGYVAGHVGSDWDQGSCDMECVPKNRFDEVLDRMDTHHPISYHIMDYNCQHWAAEVLN
jgi:RHS repeat-associated protein